MDDEKIHTMAETMALVEASLTEALRDVRKLIITEGDTRRPLIERFDEFTADLLSKI